MYTSITVNMLTFISVDRFALFNPVLSMFKLFTQFMYMCIRKVNVKIFLQLLASNIKNVCTVSFLRKGT